MRYAERQTVAKETPVQQVGETVFDPLRFCIFTTIALIAWMFGPALAVMLMSGMGLWAYTRAWRQGLRQSKCFLRDPRLIIAYLGIAFISGFVATVSRVLQIIS